jgi:hypothetical protein
MNDGEKELFRAEAELRKRLTHDEMAAYQRKVGSLSSEEWKLRIRAVGEQGWEPYVNEIVSAVQLPDLDGQSLASLLADSARRAFQNGPPVVVREYPCRTQADAARWFQREAEHAARYGYSPTSQSWSEGRPGFGRVVLLGFYSLMFKPDGYLTVTYTNAVSAAAVATESAAGSTKTCPMCAEQVKAAAKICRFCRHQFEPPMRDTSV